MTLVFVLLLVAALVFGILRGRRRRASLYKAGRALVLHARQPDVQDDTDRWLLTANSVYSVWMERPVDRLLDLDGRPTYKALLGQWGIKGRADLLGQLPNLFHTGDRRPMHALQRADPGLPQHDLLAFDLGRYLHLCVAGCAMGLITPDEARTLMLHAGRPLQAAYPSWDACADAFVAGMVVNRVHKSIEITRQSEARMSSLREAVQTLQRSSDSPWRSVPWTLALPTPTPHDFFDRTSEDHLTETVWYINEATFRPSDLNWALSVGAIYFSWWGSPVDQLVREAPHVFEGMRRDWGIEGREDALDILMWLHHEGHRAALRDLQHRWPTAPQQDPLAWDLVRLMQVAGNAASLRYLTPDEAANLMLHASHLLQRAYGSWSELRAAFGAGRMLWRRLKDQPLNAEVRDSDASLDRTLDLLEQDPASPWHKIPWALALSATQPGDFFSTVTAAYRAEKAGASEEAPGHDTSLLN